MTADLSPGAVGTDDTVMGLNQLLWMFLCGVLGNTGAGAVQAPPSPVGKTEPTFVGPLTPVEQTVGDRGPLDASLRKVDQGLALPAGYRFVYRREDGGMMRANGGLVAVFPQSIYVPTRRGLVPDVPPGTRFVIGGLPMGEEPGHGRLLAIDPMRPDEVPPATRSAEVEAGSRPDDVGFGPGYRVVRAVEPEFDSGLARFQLDEDYRRRRLKRLVMNVVPPPADPASDPGRP